MTAGRSGSAAFGAPFELPPLAGDRADWLNLLADGLYGPVPAPPDRLVATPLGALGEGAKHLLIEMDVGGRAMRVDAALWLPAGHDGPVPLICGLGFLGPVGVLRGDRFPLDPAARVLAPEGLGAGDGRLTQDMRGQAAYRWPVDQITQAGFGLLLTCYGSWVPDDVRVWRDQGLWELLDGPDCGAISLWAWAYSRMVDAALALPQVDGGRVVVAGHSRLGKAALWAAATDERIAAVYGNNPGCAGAAPARHNVGETLSRMVERFPHWLKPGVETDPDARVFDQHVALAAVAPRRVYLASARDDLWADPVGSYMALMAAAPVWGAVPDWPSPEEMWTTGGQQMAPHMGHHLRDGVHEMLSEDWTQALRFLSQT